ncbi:hypothetical protein ACFLT9_04470 [Acidobacteriota bacterium]
MNEFKDIKMVGTDDLIRREKEEALEGFDEQRFRFTLDREIKNLAVQPTRFFVLLKKPVVIFALTFLLAFLTWAAFRVLRPDPADQNYLVFKTVLAQAYDLHKENMDGYSSAPEAQVESAESEFQWALKRVLFSIQIEKDPLDSEVQVFQDVLRRSLAFSPTEEISY